MANAWTNLGVKANGTINPSSFVIIDSSVTTGYNVIQASAATIPIVGISQAGPKVAPNLLAALGSTAPTTQPAAVAGDSLEIFNLGDVCDLVAGTAGWNAGDPLTADATGAGVKATAGQWFGAWAFSNAASGELGQVQVAFGTA